MLATAATGIHAHQDRLPHFRNDLRFYRLVSFATFAHTRAYSVKCCRRAIFLLGHTSFHSAMHIVQYRREREGIRLEFVQCKGKTEFTVLIVVIVVIILIVVVDVVVICKNNEAHPPKYRGVTLRLPFATKEKMIVRVAPSLLPDVSTTKPTRRSLAMTRKWI